MAPVIALIGGAKVCSLRHLAHGQGTPNVVFTGGVSDKHKQALMQMSEIGVIPTRPINTFVETLCISAIEYLAAGTPLITTPPTGVKEAAGEHSMYTEPQNPRELALAIEHLLGDDARKAEMASRGQIHARQFNYRKITDQFLELMDTALSICCFKYPHSLGQMALEQPNRARAPEPHQRVLPAMQ
jgi:glycosyltransferase involved in cell wall biosynthesis